MKNKYFTNHQLQQLQCLLINHEGLKLTPYQCPAGYWSIGVGRNLESLGLHPSEASQLMALKGRYRQKKPWIIEGMIDLSEGIPKDFAVELLNNDLERCVDECERAFPFFVGLGWARQMALIDMDFNLGLPTLQKFIKTLEFLKNRQFKSASIEMLDSQWARQVKSRAKRLSWMIEFNEYPSDVPQNLIPECDIPY